MSKNVIILYFFVGILLPGTVLADTTTYRIQFQLVDESTGDPISKASVRFWRPEDDYIARRNPPNSMMATEDPSPSRPGVHHYRIYVDHDTLGPGRDAVYLFLIQKEGFGELESSIVLKRGSQTDRKETFRMSRLLGKGQAVHITVLRTDFEQTAVNEAWVMLCNQSGTTGSDGKVSFQFNEPVGGGGYCDLTIRQSTFNSIEGHKVRISMYDDDARHQSITCRLKPRSGAKPGTPESRCEKETKSGLSPEDLRHRFLKIRVMVTDKSDAGLAADRRPAVGGGTLTITLSSGAVYAGQEIQPGVYELTLDPDKDASRNGTLDFKKRGFREVTTLVSGSQLIPGPQPVVMYMETDKKDLVKEVIDALNGDMEGKMQALYDACEKLRNSERQASNYRIASLTLFGGYSKFKSLVEETQTLCATVPSLRGQIRALIHSAKTSEANLKVRTDQANQLAARCRTKADADRLEALWNEIKKLSWEVHLNGGKAEGLNNKMKGIISRAAALTNRFDHADADTPVPLNQFPSKAQEMLDALRTLRTSGAFGQAYQQVRAKRQQAVQAYHDAINKIDSYLEPAERGDPRVAGFKNRVRTQIPNVPKACDEEEAKRDLDTFIDNLANAVRDYSQKIQELKAKNPLCAWEKGEDASIADVQGREREAIMTLVMGSDIPTKLQMCRTNAGGTTTAGLPSAGTTTADDDADGVTNPRDKCPGTPVGHPVDADGCSLLQRFAKANMWIEGAESIKPGQPAWYKARGDGEFTNLLSAMTGALIYRWHIDGREVGKGTENFQYNLPSDSASKQITVLARLFWVDSRTLKEVPLKSAQKTFSVLAPLPGQTTTKKYGPFDVPWGSWFATGVRIKKGESFEVKASGAYKNTNPKAETKECGPGGCGYWRWWVLKVKIGNQKQDVHSTGGGTALQDGEIELGCPRGGEFAKEDAGGFSGSLSVELFVKERPGPR